MLVNARTVTKAIAAKKLALKPIAEILLNIPLSGFATQMTPMRPRAAAISIVVVTCSLRNNQAIKGIKIGDEYVNTMALESFKCAIA